MREISVYDLKLNPTDLFSTDWALLTAGDQLESYNAMTISWGSMGSIWGRSSGNSKHFGLPVMTVYVRPQRYTRVFIDRDEHFTVSFFGKEYRKDLAYLGAHSGRDEDKIIKVGFTPKHDGYNAVYFDEADLVFVCRKIYQAPIIESGFKDDDVRDSTYPLKDYHDLYIGEIERVLIKEDTIEKYT